MFLLSPKTTAQEYELIALDPVSINGGPAQTYGGEVPSGLVKPGDELSWSGGGLSAVGYLDANDIVLKDTSSASPYTVAAVPGATKLEVVLQQV